MPLDRPVSNLLREPGRNWTPWPPASEAAIERLQKRVPFDLPEEYIDLLRFCEGGDGDLDLPPLMFRMDSIDESISHNDVWKREGVYSGFWFFGGNGGGDSIAFDLRVGPPHPMVMIDCIAGDDSAVRMAANIAEFIKKIGLRAPETL
jgi:hypothetical protein